MIIDERKFIGVLEKNKDIQCRITGKFIKNGDIRSYLLECRVDRRVLVSEVQEERVIELIKLNRIISCKLMNYNGKDTIIGTARVPVYRDIKDVKYLSDKSEIFNFGDMLVIGRILDLKDRRKCIGYEVLFKDGKIHNIEKGAVIRLAKNGIVRNMDVVQIDGRNALKGVGISLSDLPTKESNAEDLEIMG